MSNYPPGVTGREYEIAGPDNEWEEEFECWNEEFQYIRISTFAFQWASDLGKKVHTTTGKEDVKNHLHDYLAILNALFNMPDMASDIITEKCDFVGDVLKQSYRGKSWWQCPKCGKEYEEYMERYYHE